MLRKLWDVQRTYILRALSLSLSLSQAQITIFFICRKIDCSLRAVHFLCLPRQEDRPYEYWSLPFSLGAYVSSHGIYHVLLKTYECIYVLYTISAVPCECFFEFFLPLSRYPRMEQKQKGWGVGEAYLIWRQPFKRTSSSYLDGGKNTKKNWFLSATSDIESITSYRK